MSLKIKGQKHLNSNWYQSIRIKSINQDLSKGLIDVKIKNRFANENNTTIDLVPTSTPKFMDTIKDLNEIEQIKEILEYYERNNTICKLIEENGVHFLSTSGRWLDVEMGFTSENKEYLRKSISELLFNYLDSRLRFFDGCQACSFNIVGNEEQSFYETYEDLDGSNETVWLHLLCEHNPENLSDFGKLSDFEKKFIEDFVLEKTYMQKKVAIIQDNWRRGIEEDDWCMKTNSLNVHDYIISCGDVTFHFARIATKDLNDLTKKINAYNETFIKQENMQLKLDLGGKKK